MSYRKSRWSKSRELKSAECIYQYYILRRDFWTKKYEGAQFPEEKQAYSEKIQRSLTRAVFRGKEYLQALAREIPALVNTERMKLKELENALC
jgi:hypothetical protein